MRPSQFDFVQPTSLREASTLARNGAVLLSGGQALIQALRLRTTSPAQIVDLKHIPDLPREVSVVSGGIRIGALVTVTDLLESELIASRLPMLRQSAGRLGDVQVRNRATVAGNVCWGDPRANLAVALLAYDAILRVHDGQSERSLPVAECFAGFRALALEPGEIVVAIDIPVAADADASEYQEFSRQRNDLALVNMAVLRRSNGDYSVAGGGLAQTPLRLKEVERVFEAATRCPTVELLTAAIEKSSLSPLGDPFGPLSYKVHVGAVLLSRMYAKINDGVSHVAA